MEQGKHVTDTIELLEAIGRDASLRHASAEELAPVLEQANASDALKAAVAAGEGSPLARELGHQPNRTPQISNAPGHEEHEPDHHRDDKPPRPSEPEHRTPHNR